MNKLILKNPVQRFKMGKQIVKAAGGFNMSRLIRHGSGNSSSYTDANGNIVFQNGKMSDKAVKYMKSRGYSDSYINRTIENMRAGNVWDRNLKTAKNPYGRWRIDNGRSDSKWNTDIQKEALKNRKDIRQEKNGQYSFMTASGKRLYLNEPIQQTSQKKQNVQQKQSNSNNMYFRDNEGHIVGRQLDDGKWTYRAPVDYEWYSGLPGKNDDILQFTSSTPLTMDQYNQIQKQWNHYNSGFLDAFFRSSEKAAQNMNDWAVRAYGRTNNPNEYMNRLGLIFSTRESPYTKMHKVYQDIEKGLSQKQNSSGYTTYTPTSENAAGGFYKEGGQITNSGIIKASSGTGLKLFNKIGVDKTYTRANDRFANITQGQKDILNTLGISGNNALELQKSINSYLSKNGLGGIAEDNKWGGQSQAALDYILNSTDAGIKAPAALRKENLESVNYSTPAQVAPVIQIPEVIQAPTIQLNRKQTRQRIRNLGLNPYDYSGEQRRALRLYLNGESNDTSLLTNGLERFIVKPKPNITREQAFNLFNYPNRFGQQAIDYSQFDWNRKLQQFKNLNLADLSKYFNVQ